MHTNLDLGTQNKKGLKSSDNVITFLHILGTFMIFFRHVFQAFDNSFLGELFLSGVPLFLFVAGYLSGKQKIDNALRWLGKRFKRVLIPSTIYVIIVNFLSLYFGVEKKITLFEWLICLLNLHGLSYTYWKFDSYWSTEGTGHLWFVTTICFCYLLTPIIQHFRSSFLKIKRPITIIPVVLLFQLVLMYGGWTLGYIITYFLGYFVAIKPIRTDLRWNVFVSLMMIASNIFRLIARHYIDGTDLYMRYIVLISAATIAIWIFYMSYSLERVFPTLFSAFNTPSFRFVERLSYYIYLTHSMFVFDIYSFFANVSVFFRCFWVVALTFLTSFVLWYVTERIIFSFIGRK